MVTDLVTVWSRFWARMPVCLNRSQSPCQDVKLLDSCGWRHPQSRYVLLGRHRLGTVCKTAMRRFDPARRLQTLHPPAPGPPRRPLYPWTCWAGNFDQLFPAMQYHQCSLFGNRLVFCPQTSCLVSFAPSVPL